MEKVKSDPLPGVKNIIAIASGKGGVGKSTIATNLAIATAQKGYDVGIIDADIFGPSLPKMFNIENEETTVMHINSENLIIPVSHFGVKILSIGLFIEPDDAMVWRGPMASNALKQLIKDGDWGALDYLFIDLPPGTSDIHLTLVQTVPVTGAIIVSTPQDVALADAIKGINMFQGDKINVPILGLVENMSWFTPEELPDRKYYIFGKDGCKALAERKHIPLLGQIPLIQSIREGCDFGNPAVIGDQITSNAFKELAENLIKQIAFRHKNIPHTRVVEVRKH
jgi:ATP-binding protein involved in chromosome partitioning